MIGARKTKILVVDDHPFLREGIVGAINSQSDMVLIAEASNGREAIEQFRIHRPDVTLMDLQETTVKTHVQNIVVKLARVIGLTL
jgi:DNA-binding NarL/FixJ family response regulator